MIPVNIFLSFLPFHPRWKWRANLIQWGKGNWIPSFVSHFNQRQDKRPSYSVFLKIFLLNFLLHHEACGILVSQLKGLSLCLLQRAWVLTTGSSGKSRIFFMRYFILIFTSALPFPSLLISQKTGLCCPSNVLKHPCSRDFTLMVALPGCFPPRSFHGSFQHFSRFFSNVILNKHALADYPNHLPLCSTIPFTLCLLYKLWLSMYLFIVCLPTLDCKLRQSRDLFCLPLCSQCLEWFSGKWSRCLKNTDWMSKQIFKP